MASPVSTWLYPTPSGLYCAPGGFHVDPVVPVDRAVITHGHADHARAGHRHVLATAQTLAIMGVRYGAEFAGATQALRYGETLTVGSVAVTLHPAGHVLGSAQVAMAHGGARAVVSGDYKRRRDPTCPAFEPVACDVFVSEATFGLPVFRHPDDAGEVAKLLRSLALFPDRSHVVGVYALGKAQRLIRLIREAGWDRPIHIHGALKALCDLYEGLGVGLGDLRPATLGPGGAGKAAFAGALVLAPPSALADRWSRRLADPVSAMASGWMGVRARARQRGAELPLVISDHADWDELTATFEDVGAPEIWITHGREEALVHWARQRGFDAKALSLAGRDEEAE
ncbi:MAG: ligase-associated DNA damage response exonuclease [Alphaproteobacteria bacterium]